MASKLGRDLRIGFDDEHASALVRLGGGNRALKFGNRGDVQCDRPEARGMSREVDHRQDLVAGIFQQIVEAGAPSRSL